MQSNPLRAGALVLLAVAGLLAFRSWQDPSGDHRRVAAGADGRVRIPLATLKREEVRFYRYLNPGNQEVKFFVGRDPAGTLQVAFDASENHFKLGRGFRAQNGWIVDNKCGTSIRLDRVNAGGGGCAPIPLAHRIEGGDLVLTPDDLLQGWRYFR